MKGVYLSDIPRLYTGLAEWCGCMVIIAKYHKRFSGLKLWQILGTGLVIQCLFLALTDSLSIFLWIPCMAAAVGLMMLFIAVCCDMPLTTAGYCTVRAFLLAEFAASLEWQLYSYVTYVTGWERGGALSVVFLVLVYVPVFQAMYMLEAKREDPMTAMAFQMYELASPILIALACFAVSNLGFVYSQGPFIGSALGDVYNIRTLVDLAGVAMLYAYHTQRCGLGIQDKGKRLIHLAVYTKKDFLVIQCENYCPITPEFQDGLPVSTKEDKAYHGFGIKSIRHSAEKYGGAMAVRSEAEWFVISLMIPLK